VAERRRKSASTRPDLAGPPPAGLPAPLCSPDCAPIFEPVDRPLWREAAWPLEWLALRLSPAYYGCVGHRGSGGPVVVVPGFLASDLYLAELHLWLGRAGYRPVFSDIGRNADCPDVLLERLIETVDGVHERTGRKVQIIGHSFGGVLARAAAGRRPEGVSQVITLAAPFRFLRAHRLVLEAARLLGELLPPPYVRPRPHRDHSHATRCSCKFLREELEWPPGVRRAAIYSRNDGVVDWRACLEEDPGLNFEVRGTHTGLVLNPEVYGLLARLLAEGGRGRARRVLRV